MTDERPTLRGLALSGYRQDRMVATVRFQAFWQSAF